MYIRDTIAAIATPPGRGGVGIIRISGPQCREIANAVFRCTASAQSWTPRRLYHGHMLDDSGAILDEGLAVMMPAPHSYTGEDILELHGHGSPISLRRILAHTLRHGARLAEPGEFTKRAFLNGRMDLAQAEAVRDLIDAPSSASAKLAITQLSGGLSQHVQALRADLITLKALLEIQIDFSEEDVVIDMAELRNRSQSSLHALSMLHESYHHGKIARDGLQVTIVGTPNVGKSSLLNALLGEERAIVSDLAGTTRDTIEESIEIAGIPLIFSDTAGLRDIAQADHVEQIGIQRTKDRVATAHVLCAVLDLSRPLTPEDREVLATLSAQPQPAIIIANKTDLAPGVPWEQLRHLLDTWPVIAISAKYHLGIHALRQCILTQVTAHAPQDTHTPVLTQTRHAAAISQARESLELALRSIDAQQPPDLIAVDVQDSIDHISHITGEVTNEDILDKIFHDFCIGK